MPRKNKNASKRVRPAAERSNPRRRVAPASKPEVLFRAALIAAGCGGEFEEQYRFHPKRRWLFDFAFPEDKVAIEIEGGIFVRGRHVSPSGFVKDCEKYNAATSMGWRVLRVPVAGKTWLDDGIEAMHATFDYIEEQET